MTRTVLTGRIGNGSKVHRIVKMERDNKTDHWCFCGAGIVNKPGKSPITVLDDNAEVTCAKCHAQNL